jgi:hypothetical protein
MRPREFLLVLALVALAGLLSGPRLALAEAAIDQVSAAACGTLRARVDAVPGSGPAFLRSYDSGAGEGAGSEPALLGAFTYDNALAVIALEACGEGAAAVRIGDALLAAAQADRSGDPGRLRNAYRAGAVTQRPVPPMGWWSDQQQRWDEDPYQVGTATGNVAWAALALLTLDAATHDEHYRDGAIRLAHWAMATAYDAHAPAGFSGGLYGYDTAPQRLTWKSTEHNTDLAAVFDWLARLQPDAGWQQPAGAARGFVATEWDATGGRFWIGTLPDGVTPNRHNSGLDAQLWPLLLADAPPAWRAAIGNVERSYGVAGGFDFNDDRDGIWWEGTAQAALVYRALGRPKDADRLLAAIARQFSPGGMIWASSLPRITTGLALSPASTSDDFYYYRLPHLGATAWAALAAKAWNPFTGQRVAGIR